MELSFPFGTLFLGENISVIDTHKPIYNAIQLTAILRVAKLIHLLAIVSKNKETERGLMVIMTTKAGASLHVNFNRNFLACTQRRFC